MFKNINVVRATYRTYYCPEGRKRFFSLGQILSARRIIRGFNQEFHSRPVHNL